MFDLLGVVQKHDRPINTSFRPFKHIAAIEKIRFSETMLDFGSQCWWLLHREMEPAMYDDEQMCVLLHGECYQKVYDHAGPGKRKLTAFDLGQRFKAGRDVMSDVKGSFIIIVIDHNKQSVDVYSDPLNLRTAYYISVSGDLVVSTSLTAIHNYLSEAGHALRPDQRAILDHYLFDFTLDDHTYLNGVLELGAGSRLFYADGKLSLTQYFKPFECFKLTDSTLGWNEGAAQVKEILARNVNLYNNGPAETAVALTGGFDSRSIVALLNDDIRDFTFFSYGKSQSLDVRIPQSIAEKLHLNYVPVFLESEYENSYAYFGKLAVQLSDGAAELSHANIPFVYANNFLDKNSILTGLFGSELIKTPSSRGLFLDHNMVEILDAKDPVAAIQSIFERLNALNIELPFYNKDTREQVIEIIRSHPYINNELPLNEKYFYYVLMVGARKYFRKETKIQRYWKTNLHPFFDTEFIARLLETPFPWVYNFSRKKSLLKNIGIHKLYAFLINENPILGDIISTHGYRPRHLLSVSGTMQLAVEYFMNKNKFSNASSLQFQQAYSLKAIEGNEDNMLGGSAFRLKNAKEKMRSKDFIKMASLAHWYKSIGLDV